MNQCKLEVVKQEMATVNIDILGISELKWTRTGKFNLDDHYIYYCGQEFLRRNGVALIINNSPKCSTWVQSKNDRIISICFQNKPFNITVIQVYAPTTNAEEAEGLPRKPTRFSRNNNSKKRCPFHHRGLDTKVRSQKISKVTGKFGLGVQNEVGQRLTECCQENVLVIANTLFQQHKSRLYTWTSPDGQYQIQIDYILCSRRWRSSIQSSKTRLGA